jgi:hypothetical protein
MQISEYAATDAAEIRRIGASAKAAELYTRDDGKGSLIVSEGAPPAGAEATRTVEVLFTGGEFGANGGDWLFHVGLWTPPDFRDEFLAWYKMEHMPILLECPIWDGCRFIEQKVDNGCQFYAVHQMSDKAALDSSERKRSRATPWFMRLSKQSWFDGAFTRMLCKRLAA